MAGAVPAAGGNPWRDGLGLPPDDDTRASMMEGLALADALRAELGGLVPFGAPAGMPLEAAPEARRE